MKSFISELTDQQKQILKSKCHRMYSGNVFLLFGVFGINISTDTTADGSSTQPDDNMDGIPQLLYYAERLLEDTLLSH